MKLIVTRLTTGADLLMFKNDNDSVPTTEEVLEAVRECKITIHYVMKAETGFLTAFFGGGSNADER